MGINVSTHLCIRRPDREIEYLCDGPWIPRDYRLYDLMGMSDGGGSVPLFEPRGVPSDASARLRHELGVGPRGQLDPDHYFRSWLTTDDLREIARAYESGSASQTDGPIKVSPHFAATIGAMEAVDQWCAEAGGGQAILAFSFG